MDAMPVSATIPEPRVKAGPAPDFAARRSSQNHSAATTISARATKGRTSPHLECSAGLPTRAASAWPDSFAMKAAPAPTSRPAKVTQMKVRRHFGTSTRAMSASADNGSRTTARWTMSEWTGRPVTVSNGPSEARMPPRAVEGFTHALHRLYGDSACWKCRPYRELTRFVCSSIAPGSHRGSGHRLTPSQPADRAGHSPQME